MRNAKLIASLLCAVVLLTFGGATQSASAGPTSFPIWKTYFPPFSGTGTIIEIGDLTRGSGETCIVYLNDADGAMYFFNGIENYAPGTRVKVTGNTCTICLYTLTCGMPVSAILNAQVTII